MDQKKINEILRDHKEWVESNGGEGKRANFRGIDLRGADLHDACLFEVDLRGADLHWANLCGAYLFGADLRNADLCGADLHNAILCNANICSANLCGSDLRLADLHGVHFRGANISEADLRGAMMPKGIYTAGGVGSEQRYTYYDAVNDRVICGCWDDDSGNHLNSFKKRIEDVYGKDGKTPNTKHYKAYQAVIRYFEFCRDAYN